MDDFPIVSSVYHDPCEVGALKVNELDARAVEELLVAMAGSHGSGVDD